MPASHILEDEDDPIWKPERRHLRVLRNVLPEKNSDRLVRHFRSLQEVGQREREQALQRGTGIGGQAPFIGSAMAGPPPIPAGPPSLSSMTVFAQVPYAVSIATSNPLLLSTDNPSLAGTAMYATAPPPQAGPPIPSFSSSVPPHHAFPAPSAGPPSSSSTATSKPVHARQPPTQTSAAPVSSTPQPPPPLPPPPPATATATASVLLESRERADI
ncbi:hypothetical protein DFJ77DRAFT_354453 [Powellomyces hirtus]|nr:hypothetical protein DFJ77DRAFT_354453 [Powellomyces hirtus]